ncbi:MAG: phage BR0599 family protein [Pseudomonadota bacterium]|nr:phage BR0599 family protein [Pseudomonadota bacterium]MDE3037897.1 phage BR0599 family protein [Pseudomonadota bacterium]
MKSAPSAVISALQTSRELSFADCFTITLADSTVARYTNAQYDVSIPQIGNPALLFIAGDILVDGLKLKQTCGVDIDEQSIDISFKPTSTIAGLPWPIAVREGRFDGATIDRARAVLTAPGGTVIGSAAVVVFHGLVATVDNIGRLSSKMTVKSMLNKLAVDMPRDIWQPCCLNTLYDGLCTMVKSANGASGTVGASPTLSFIPWSGSAADTYDQGTVTFESGANVGVSRTVQVSTTSGLTLSRPLDYLPVAGDSFVVYKGCDKTMATCQNRFSNLANFRGFPFVPPPELAMY